VPELEKENRELKERIKELEEETQRMVWPFNRWKYIW
jgi:cell division protein FtsB